MPTKARPRRKNAFLGLDLGSTAVKALEMSRVGSTLAITNCALAEVSRESGHAEAVRAVLDAGDFDAENIAIGLSGRGAVAQTISLPAERVDNLNEAVMAEAKNLIPFPLEEAFVDYHVDPNKHDRDMSVLVAATRRGTVHEKLATLGKIDVHPAVVDLELIALANALETMASASGETRTPSCIVDFGARKTLIAVSDGVTHVFREFAFGGTKLTEMIAYRFGCGANEAEALKLAPGDKMDMVKDAVYPGIEDLAAEIRSALRRFKEQSGGGQVAHIYLSGGLVRFSAIVPLFGKMLSVKSSAFNPFGTLGTEDMDLAFLDANSHRFSVAFGLACHART